MADRRSITPKFIYVPVPPNLHRDPPLYFDLNPERGPGGRYTFHSWHAEGLATYEKEKRIDWESVPKYEKVAP